MSSGLSLSNAIILCVALIAYVLTHTYTHTHCSADIPMLVAGDFNSTPGSPAHMLLNTCHFIEALLLTTAPSYKTSLSRQLCAHAVGRGLGVSLEAQMSAVAHGSVSQSMRWLRGSGCQQV
eukprot:1157837-Pelagomonas_calceolata.AAC.15